MFGVDFKFIISTGIAFLVGLVPFVVYYLSTQRKVIGYNILTKASLIKVSPDIKRKITISLQDKPVDNICTFQILTKNIGTRDIKNQAIFFIWDEKAEVIDANISTKPQYGFGAITLEDTGDTLCEWNPKKVMFYKYRIELMNPLDEILFSFTTINNESLEFSIYAKGEELKCKKFDQKRFISPGVNKLIIAIAILIAFSVTYFLTISSPKYPTWVEGKEIWDLIFVSMAVLSLIFVPIWIGLSLLTKSMLERIKK